MGKEFKIGERVTVPATVNGYGVDILSEVIMVEKFLGATLVTVRYIEPSEVGFRTGKVCFDFHLKRLSDAEEDF